MNLKLQLLSLLTLAGVAALAQPLNYAQATVEVKAGTLVLPGQVTAGGFADNPAPHVWFNLDQDNTVKPAKWSFVNPIGPTVLTTGVRARWAAIDPTGTPAAGARLTKASGPYWEVPLDTTPVETLARFDILNITINKTLSLNPSERDKLRKYMDRGGVVWVDLVDDPNANINLDIVNPLPFPFEWAGSNAALDANFFHSLLRFPNQITMNDLVNSEYSNVVNRVVTRPSTNMPARLEPFQRWIGVDSASLQPVAGTADGNTISIGQIGQGHLIVTSRGVSANLNRGLPFPGSTVFNVNRGFTGLKTPADTAFVAAAKLALNILSSGGVWKGRHAGSSHTGSNNVDLTAPLLRAFNDDQGAGSGSFEIEQQPALYKGRMIATKGNRLYVYDTRPDRDLDGDGSADDGLQNPVGSQADLMWVSPALGSVLSAPTVVEAPNTVLTNPNRPGFKPTDQIWVMDDQSRVYIFDLDTDGAVVGATWPPIGSIAPPAGSVGSAGTPFAPVVHESLVFMTDSANITGQTTGRVWIADLNDAAVAQSGGGDWKITASARMGEPSGPATVGYIPIQDGSGGFDRVVYVPTRPANGITPRPAGMASIWLGARSESPIRTEYDSNTQVLSLTTRASYFGLPIYLDNGGSPTELRSLGLKFSIIDGSGNPLNTTQVDQILGPASSPSQATNGVLLIQGVQSMGYDLDGKQTPQTTDDVTFRVDYTVEWGKAGTGAFQPQFENYVRGNLEFPDDTRNLREVIGSPALDSDGTVYVVTSFVSGSDAGGTVMGFRENKGPGNFSMISRFELYDRHKFNLNNSVGAGDEIDMPPVITDEDQLVLLLPFLNRDIAQWRFTSGPVLRGDSMFVMASGVKNIGFGPAPTGVMMSFRKGAATPSFEIEGQDSNFTLVQPDTALSFPKNQPNQYSVLQQGQFTLEPIVGTTRSRIVLNSLMNVTRGRIRDSISASMPIIVRRGGQTDTLIEPEALADNGRIIAGRAQGRWNPLAWYMVFNGYRAGAGPIVCGDTLFQGGASILPSLIANGSFVFNGLIFAMDANVSPNDEFLIANSVRPWTLQLNSFLGNSWNTIRPANSVKWPQFKGIQDVDDLRIRVLQAAIEEDGVRAIAGGDDSLAVAGPTTLYGFRRSDFLVVDSGRISRIDPVGNPIWTTDQTFVAGTQQPTTSFGVAKQLSEPTRMYSTGDNGYWVVDTGNNRVVRIDGAARELRTVEKMRLDPQFKPDGINDQGAAAGMSPGETLKLRRPKDVLVFERLVDGTVPGQNPFSNAQPLERWTHMVIADSGNNRIVELVDRYVVDRATGRTGPAVKYEDPPGSGNFVTALGVLYWHTPEELTGKDYRYNSIARTIQDIGGQRHNVVGFGFGNVEPGTATLGLDNTNQNVDRNSGNGGVVLYDGPSSIVIREFERPAIQRNTFIIEDPNTAGQYDYLSPSADQAARMQKFVGLSSVTVRYVTVNNAVVLSVMVTDATGVYELVQDTARNVWVVRWMLPAEAFKGLRHPRGNGPYSTPGMGQNPKGFRPMYARRLDSGEVLVVNGYTGRRIDDTEFLGEVVLVDGSFASAGTQVEDPGYAMTRRNLGFNRLSVKFEVPPVQGVRGIVSPVFAHRQ